MENPSSLSCTAISGSATAGSMKSIICISDTSAILAETYDKIGAQLPQDQRAEVSEMQMIDFIDPAVAEPLVTVQDKLEGFSMRPGMEEKEK